MAGDSYAGGLCAGLIKGLTIDESLHIAGYCASYIIRQTGCTLNEEPKFKL